MKKVIAVLLCSVFMIGLVGCGSAKNDAEQTPGGDTTVSVAIDAVDATDLMTKVWNSYDDADKFPIGGGDYDNIVMDAPGKYDVSKVEDLDAVLGLPQNAATMIDDAASVMHMMNANTFTAGAYHLADASNQQALADGLKDNIMNRQWMCGFPDTLIIASVGDEYVVSAFGKAEIIEKFKTNLQAQYEVTEIMYEESLVQ